MSSRPQGYTSAPCQHIDVTLEVLPFSHAEVRLFVRNWFLQNEIKFQGVEDSGVRADAAAKADVLMREIEANEVLSELAINPLLLTMITTVLHHQNLIPESRVALYKEICEVLLVRRQRAKGLEDNLNALKKQALLQRLALNLMQANTREFELEQAEEWLGQRLAAEVAGSEVGVANFHPGRCATQWSHRRTRAWIVRV